MIAHDHVNCMIIIFREILNTVAIHPFSFGFSLSARYSQSISLPKEHIVDLCFRLQPGSSGLYLLPKWSARRLFGNSPIAVSQCKRDLHSLVNSYKQRRIAINIQKLRLLKCDSGPLLLFSSVQTASTAPAP